MLFSCLGLSYRLVFPPLLLTSSSQPDFVWSSWCGRRHLLQSPIFWYPTSSSRIALCLLPGHQEWSRNGSSPFVLYNSLLFGGCGNTVLTHVRASYFWNCINCNSPVERLEGKKKKNMFRVQRCSHGYWDRYITGGGTLLACNSPCRWFMALHKLLLNREVF